MKNKEARAVAAEIGAAVSDWRDTAKDIGLSAREIERMASAFQHADLNKALA